MSKAGEQIIAAAQSGISAIHFFNPITGKSEPFTTNEMALSSMLASAGEKIRELEREIAEIRSYLVMDQKTIPNIIEISAERAKRERPDADCIRHDAGGNELNMFAIDYRICDKTFSFEIWATSFDEAEAHVEAIRSSAVVAGRIKARGTL